jgi:hypothetical protein
LYQQGIERAGVIADEDSRSPAWKLMRRPHCQLVIDPRKTDIQRAKHSNGQLVFRTRIMARRTLVHGGGIPEARRFEKNEFPNLLRGWIPKSDRDNPRSLD